MRSFAAALVKELRDCSSAVGRLVTDALTLSEHEVFAAGQCVISINNEAKLHATDLDALANQFADGNTANRRTMAQAIQKQSETCSAFADELGAQLRDQAELAMRALELTKRIAHFGDQITSISMEARILTLNADIESKRLGKAGAAFGSIAGEMRHLSASVQSTNQAVAELAGDLTRILPKLASSSHVMLRHSEVFSEQLVKQLADVQAAYDDTQHCVTEALTESQKRAERIFAETGQVLAHLQFQDRMAKELTRARQQVDATANVVERTLHELPHDTALAPDGYGTPSPSPGDTPPSSAEPNFAATSSIAPVSEGSMLQAGEVELF